MAEVTIVYKELEQAAEKAREIATACNQYEDELQSKVCGKVPGVAPSPLPAGNSRLSTANMYVKNKKRQLSDKSSNYKDFAKRCDSLSTNAENADKRVGVQVNNSRENFLKDHPGLKGDGWDAFIATLITEVPVLGWLVDRHNDIQNWKRDVKNNIRKWYEIDGGKKIVDTALAVVGIVVAAVILVDAAIAAVAAVAAIASIGTFLSALGAVAGLVGAVIGAVNASVNLGTQLTANSCKDPAFANYYGKQNDLATVLKKKTFRGKYRNWNNGSMKWANALEITETVCAVVSIVKGVADIFKSSGIRDMCGKTVKGKALNGNEVDVFKYDFSKVKKTFTTKEGWSKMGKCIKTNWKNMLLGDDGFKGTEKTFKEAYDLKDVKNVEDLKKVTGAMKKGAKLYQTSVTWGERKFKEYLYDEYDVGGTIDTVIEVTGVEGGVDTVNNIYGEIKDAVGFEDTISFKKKRYTGNVKAAGGGGGSTWEPENPVNGKKSSW